MLKSLFYFRLPEMIPFTFYLIFPTSQYQILSYFLNKLFWVTWYLKQLKPFHYSKKSLYLCFISDTFHLSGLQKKQKKKGPLVSLCFLLVPLETRSYNNGVG